MRVEVRLALPGAVATVGHLLDAERRIHFQYTPAFLGSGLQLSPFKLPLGPEVRSDGLAEFHGLYGLFFDSLPDGWGLALMHQRMRQRGIDPHRISVLAWLRHLGERAMGALTFHPADEAEIEGPLEIALAELGEQAVKVFEGDSARVLPELELAGGSPGGARPKVVVALDDSGRAIAGADVLPPGFVHWLVKFTARGNLEDAAALEEVYARMARDGGLRIPQTQLISLGGRRRCFAIQRFDRDGATRRHMHTLGGLLHASHRVPSLDYVDFMRATDALTRSHREVVEAFRRMCFNVLACNRDDHVRNFSYVMSSAGEWQLSPAYDLIYSEGISGHHTTSVLGQTEHPTLDDLHQVAEEAAIPKRTAVEIVEQVAAAAASFKKHATAVKLNAATSSRVALRLSEVRKNAGRTHSTPRRKR